MPNSAIATISQPAQFTRAITTCLAGLSPNTQRAYRSAIARFQAWCLESPPGCLPRGLNRESVSLWAQSMTDAGAGGIAVNQALSALKRLTAEAASLCWLDWESAVQVQSIKSRKYRGVRTGKWLTLTQVRRFLAAPDRTTMVGKRDACVLALLLGCGLRRQEAVDLPSLSVAWKLSDQGPVMQINNLQGKGNRVRTLQVPGWAAKDIDAWVKAGNTVSGRLLRSVNGTIHASLSPSAIRDIILRYGDAIGVPGLAPHDLRRTMARLARDGGAPLESIQASLGHASVATTERYLGSTHAGDAGCYMKIENE